MQSYAILVQMQKDAKMEAEFQEIRREQDDDLREIEKAKQEMETRVADELSGVPKAKWKKRVKRINPKK